MFKIRSFKIWRVQINLEGLIFIIYKAELNWRFNGECKEIEIEKKMKGLEVVKMKLLGG